MNIQANCFVSTIIPEPVSVSRLATAGHKSLLFLTMVLGALGGPIVRLRGWSIPWCLPREIRTVWAVVAQSMAGVKWQHLKSKGHLGC